MRRRQKQTFYPTNDQIFLPQLRVIGPNGENLGVMSREMAVQEAASCSLDLVLIAQKAKPPVARIVDFSKFKYEQQKAAAKQGKGKSTELKQLKLRPNIDSHDLDVRVNKARKFLQAGNLIKFTVTFFGRTIVHKDIGHAKLDQIWEKIQDLAEIERERKMEGKQLSMIVKPKLSK